MLAAIALPIEKIPLLESVVKPLGFRQKLSVLRNLITDLENQYVPSKKLDIAYAHFASEVKKLIGAAEKLNEFRNNVVHWRPFLRVWEWEKPKLKTVSAAEINVKAFEMEELARGFWARALFLYSGDGTLTFGTHYNPKASS